MTLDTSDTRRLDEATLWQTIAETDGALRVVGDTVSGYLFATGGRPYFGVIDGSSPLPEDLAGTGIDPQIWRSALESSEARTSLSTALLRSGAPREAVAAFASTTIEATVRRLAENAAARMEVVARTHPFGTGVTFTVACEDGAWELRDAYPAQPRRQRMVLGRATGDLDDRVGRSTYSFVSRVRAEHAGQSPNRRALRRRDR